MWSDIHITMNSLCWLYSYVGFIVKDEKCSGPVGHVGPVFKIQTETIRKISV